MSVSTSQPFYDDIISKFLYGKSLTPDNVADESYLPKLQENHYSTSIDAADFMSGPGRFADPVFFELVQRFFTDDYANIFNSVRNSGKYYFIGSSIAIHKADLIDVLGLNKAGLSFNQAYFDDGEDDYASRVFFWSSTAFQISNDAVFVFGPDDTREIQNFAIEPLREGEGQGAYKNDNFDWAGGDLAEAAEPFVHPRVDPFGIGQDTDPILGEVRRGNIVDLKFTGTVTTRTTFKQADFVNGLANAPKSVAGSDLTTGTSGGALPTSFFDDTAAAAKIAATGSAFLTDLYQRGLIKYEQDGYNVFYGTDQGETIDLSSSPAALNAAYPHLLYAQHATKGAWVLGGDGDDIIRGFASSDNRLDGGAGADKLYGGSGDDTIIGDSEDTIIDGGAGYDTLDFSGSTTAVSLGASMSDIEKIVGSDLNDNLTLDNSNPLGFLSSDGIDVDGGDGNDTIIADDAPNILDGGEGNDTIKGKAGNDIIRGGGGNDTLIGGEGPYLLASDDDVISGDAGNDVIYSGSGRDVVSGGAGNDIIHVDGDIATIKFGANDGNDVVQTGEGKYQLDLGDLNPDDVEFIAGGTDITPWNSHSGDWAWPEASLNVLIVRVKSSGAQIAFIKKSNVGNQFDGNIARDGVRIEADYTTEKRYQLNEDSLDSSPLDSIKFAGATWSAKQIWSKIADYKNNPDVFFDVLKPVGEDIYGPYKGGDLPSNGPPPVIAGRGASISSLRSLAPNSSDSADFSDPISYIDHLNSSYFEEAPLPYPPAQSIVGSSDDDYFNDGFGNDTFTGRQGNDRYHLSYGDDTIVWNIGDGDDSVSGTGSHFGNDTLVLGEGIAPSDLRFTATEDGTGVIISFAAIEGSIKLSNEVGALSDRGAFSISFHDGTIWTHDDILAAASAVIASAHHYIQGTSGDDVLRNGSYDLPLVTNFTVQGGEGDDSIEVSGDGSGAIVFAKGDGHDTLKAYPDTAHRDDVRSDVLSLTDILPNDVTFKRAGNALIVTVTSTGDAFIAQDQFKGELPEVGGGVSQIVFGDSTTWTRNDILAAVSDGDGDDNLVGGNNADWLFGGDGSDVLTGGIGNDVLDGGSDDDTYRFGLGDDQDVIREDSGIGAGGDDTIEFTAGINAADVTVSQADDGNDLVLRIAGTDDSITIKKAITDASARIENVRFDDGTVWSFADLMVRETTGTAGDDVLVGSELADTLTGGPGNDALYGGSGDDIYRFSPGDGYDTIDEYYASGGGNDTIEFTAGINAADVTVSQADNGNDLVFTVPGSNRITITRTITDSDARIEKVHFADGTVWSFADMMARSQMPTAGNNTFYGYELADTLSGGAGNDVLIGRDGNDVVIGGTGNDTLDGGGDSDIYQFARGDGQDVIKESGLWPYGNSDGEDTIEFASGISANDVIVSQADSGRDLVLEIAGTSDCITIDGGIVGQYGGDDGRIEKVHFADGTIWTFADLMARSMVPTSGADTFYGSDEADTLSGGGGDDILIGRSGVDVLTGGTGNDMLKGDGDGDIYRFARGDGQDVIQDFGSTNYGNFDDDDTIEFASGISATDVIVSETNNGQDLVLQIAGTTDRITIDDGIVSQYGGDAGKIEKVHFADGTIWAFADLVARATVPTAGDDTIYGSNEAETLSGGAGNDVLFGRNGDDVIIGGAGNDQLSGDTGNDTYRFARGDGQDVIQENTITWDIGGDSDAIEFAAGIAPGDVVVTQSTDGQSLILSIAGTSDSIELQDAVTNEDDRIEQVRFTNGTIWSYADLTARIGAPANNVGQIPYPQTTNTIAFDPAEMIGTADNDYAMARSGEAGGANFTAISGLAGNDYLNNESWAGSIDGGDGNDVLEVRNNDLSVTGGAGSDYFLFDAGNFVGASWGLDSQYTWATIADFQDGSDKIAILNTVADFDDLTLTQAGSDVEVTMAGAPKIVVANTLIGDLTADDFIVRLGGDAGTSPASGGVPYPDTTNIVPYDSAQMQGTAANDSLFALSGDDGGANGTALLGREGNDLLISESWNSLLSGGAGNDVLEIRNDDALAIGGAGHDYFVFDPATFVGESWALDPQYLWGTIEGFTHGEDKIVLGSGSYEDLTIAQVDDNVEISMQGAPRIVLRGASLSDIDESDFLFAGSESQQRAGTPAGPAGTSSEHEMTERPITLEAEAPLGSFDMASGNRASIYRNAALLSQSIASFGQASAGELSRDDLFRQTDSDFWLARHATHSGVAMRYSAYQVAA